MNLRFALGLAALSIALLPRTASAYCRTTTSETFEPTAAHPCDTAGKPLFWTSKCVGFSLQQNASVQVDLATARGIANEAFTQWSSAQCPADTVACTGSVVGTPNIAAQDIGPVACDQVEFNQGDGGNANDIIFRDGVWPHEGTALALTTVTFNVQTGEIYDADMEIQSNPTEVKLGVHDPIAANEYDLRSIVTHEAGHFLGMAHTQTTNTQSTMFSTYRAGQTFMRSLSPDDACGICNAYPPTRTATCSPDPRGGLVSNCGGSASSSKGCGCAVVGAPSPLSLGALVAGVLALAAVRRRRR